MLPFPRGDCNSFTKLHENFTGPPGPFWRFRLPAREGGGPGAVPPPRRQNGRPSRRRAAVSYRICTAAGPLPAFGCALQPLEQLLPLGLVPGLAPQRAPALRGPPLLHFLGGDELRLRQGPAFAGPWAALTRRARSAGLLGKPPGPLPAFGCALQPLEQLLPLSLVPGLAPQRAPALRGPLFCTSSAEINSACGKVRPSPDLGRRSRAGPAPRASRASPRGLCPRLDAPYSRLSSSSR